MSMVTRMYSRKALLSLLAIILLTFALTAPLIQAQVTNLGVDKASYLPGDVVTVFGRASPNTLVGLQVNDPKETALLLVTVTADSNGSFTKKFKLPADATEGSYVVSASDAGVRFQTTFSVSKTARIPPPVPTPTSSPPTAAELNVLTAPQSSVEPGASLTFTWEVLNGNPGFIAHTAIHYGPASGDPTKTFFGFPELTQEFNVIRELTPKKFSATIKAPDKPGGVYWRAHAIVDGKDIWSSEGLIDITVEAAFSKRLGTLESGIADLKKGLKEAQSGIEATRSGQSKASSDLATVKTDVDKLRADIATLKSDTSGLKSDVKAQKENPPGQSASNAPFSPNILTAIAISSLAVAVVAAALAGIALARARTSKPLI